MNISIWSFKKSFSLLSQRISCITENKKSKSLFSRLLLMSFVFLIPSIQPVQGWFLALFSSNLPPSGWSSESLLKVESLLFAGQMDARAIGSLLGSQQKTWAEIFQGGYLLGGCPEIVLEGKKGADGTPTPHLGLGSPARVQGGCEQDLWAQEASGSPLNLDVYTHPHAYSFPGTRETWKLRFKIPALFPLAACPGHRGPAIALFSKGSSLAGIYRGIWAPLKWRKKANTWNHIFHSTKHYKSVSCPFQCSN